MTFDEANVWCMDHKVEVASTNDGRTLQLSAHGHAVSADLSDGSWYTWKETFIRLVQRLREQLPSPAGSNGEGPDENGSRKHGASKRRQFRRNELAVTVSSVA